MNKLGLFIQIAIDGNLQSELLAELIKNESPC